MTDDAKSTITSKYQTTVPREIRERLQVGRGDVLHWRLENGAVRVVPSRTAFLARRGTIRVGAGSVVDDVRKLRATRGTEKTGTDR